MHGLRIRYSGGSRRTSTLLAASVWVGAVFMAPLAQAAPIVSSFDSGLEGWTTINTGSFTWEMAGGNPAGFLRLDNDESGIAEIFAPAAFLGDLSSYIGGTLSFDASLLAGGGSFFDGPNGIPGGVYPDYGTLRLVGPSISAQVDLLPNGATPPLGAWQTYSIALNAAAWGLSNADFAALMQNVTLLSINVEGLWGAEIEGIDNVRLAGGQPPGTVPEPATLMLLGTGLTALTWRRLRARARRAPWPASPDQDPRQ